MDVIIGLFFVGLAAVVIIDTFAGAAAWMIEKLFDFQELPYWIEALAEVLDR